VKDSETLGRQARRVIRRPVFAASGITLVVLSVGALVSYWIARSPALLPFVSTVVPVAVIAYLSVVFTIAARTKK
jgi:FtsH-binding integral membrane protein